MDLGLDGRVILVVGGDGYIGSEVSGRLRAEGATVVSASRHSDELVMDARDDVSVVDAVRFVVERHGRLDGVVVAAAPSARTLDPDLSFDPDDVLEAIDAKAMSFLRVARAAIDVMRGDGGGRIVAVSGQNASLTGDLRGSVRNGALILAAKNLADSVAGTGITVNVVNPGVVVDEPVPEVQPAKGGQSSPTDIAALIAFLVSPLAAAISGESIAVGHRVRGVTGL